MELTHVLKKSASTVILIFWCHCNCHCQYAIIYVYVGSRMGGIVFQQADGMSSQDAGGRNYFRKKVGKKREKSTFEPLVEPCPSSGKVNQPVPTKFVLSTRKFVLGKAFFLSNQDDFGRFGRWENRLIWNFNEIKRKPFRTTQIIIFVLILKKNTQ